MPGNATIWGLGPQTAANVALGATATASTTDGSQPWSAARAIDGTRHTNNTWFPGGSGWAGTNNISVTPDTFEIDFGVMRNIVEVDIFTIPDGFNYAVDPTLADTFTLYGLQDFKTQYWNGLAWVDVDTVIANNKVWRQFTWPSIVTSKIRLFMTASPDNFARLSEVEAWGT